MARNRGLKIINEFLLENPKTYVLLHNTTSAPKRPMTVNYQVHLEDVCCKRAFSSHLSAKPHTSVKNGFESKLPELPSIREVSQEQNAQLKEFRLNEIPLNTGSSLRNENIYWNLKRQPSWIIKRNRKFKRKDDTKSISCKPKFESEGQKSKMQEKPLVPCQPNDKSNSNPCDSNSPKLKTPCPDLVKKSKFGDPLQSNFGKIERKTDDKPCKICVPESSEENLRSITPLSCYLYEPIPTNKSFIKVKKPIADFFKRQSVDNRVASKKYVSAKTSEFQLPKISQIELNGSSFLLQELNKIKKYLVQMQTTNTNINMKDAVKMIHDIKGKINAAYKTSLFEKQIQTRINRDTKTGTLNQKSSQLTKLMDGSSPTRLPLATEKIDKDKTIIGKPKIRAREETPSYKKIGPNPIRKVLQNSKALYEPAWK